MKADAAAKAQDLRDRMDRQRDERDVRKAERQAEDAEEDAADALDYALSGRRPGGTGRPRRDRRPQLGRHAGSSITAELSS